MDVKGYSRYFKAFGDPSRLRIVSLLSGKEMTVNEIARAVQLAQPTVSRHLAVLRETGIVEDRRDGQNVFYSLNKDAVENCCHGFCDCLEIRIRKPAREKKREK